MEAEKIDPPPPTSLPRRVNGRMWQTGESGNPHGRPVGARGRFSERFIADLATAWEQHGEAALARTAVEYPDRFVGICAHLLPKDVSVSLSARLPGNLEPEDWSIALATFEAIKRALPDAGDRSPGQVLDFVLAAIRQADAKLIEAE
jgi:hypothetical protein